jgi:ribonuclease BN (tRNA processing enzyme)
MDVELELLGTGPAEGAPGDGRSRRRESSMLVRADPAAVLVDVGRDAEEQLAGVDAVDAVLLTHGHRDASGGLPALSRWWSAGDRPEIPVHAHEATIAAVRRRTRRLAGLELVAVAEGERRSVGPVSVEPLEVPHAHDPRFPTFAWRLDAGGRRIVYASDVAELTTRLERFSHGADLLVLDGAMWRRRMFTHLTIDEAVPRVCRWSVGRILLTQIGRTAPPHEELEREVRRLCPRARPAYDGLRESL